MMKDVFFPSDKKLHATVGSISQTVMVRNRNFSLLSGVMLVLHYGVLFLSF